MILSLTSICIFTFIFFRLQSFFIIGYCIIAYALFVENKKTLKRVNILIINTSLISLILWLGTTLTDIFFNTKINLILKGITGNSIGSVSYTHLRAHETPEHLVCRLLLEKKKN